MIHTDEDRRDPGIDVTDRDNGRIYYDRDQRTPNENYVSARLNAIVHILTARRRRIMMRVLADLEAEADGRRTISHEDLSREIAAVEDDVDTAHVNWRSLRNVKTGIRNHLSLLDDLNAISWDEDAREISTTKQTTAYSILLEDVEDTAESASVDGLDEWMEDPW